MQTDTLSNAIQQYQSKPDGDFWQVTTNPLREVRDKMIVDLISVLHFNSAIDFACGLGIVASMIAKMTKTVLAVDGAQPALEKAKKIHNNISNLHFRYATLDDLPALLAKNKYDLFIMTDIFSYFNYEEQSIILNQTALNNITYLLLEIRTVDRKGTKDISFHPNSDYETANEVILFIEKSNYKLLKINISRFHNDRDIIKRDAYTLLERVISIIFKRYIIQAFTVFQYLPIRFKGDKVYDPYILEKRLKMATFLYKKPILNRF
ncbi:class I SAM-dependent methyltransferase, partial [Patescibacteria group bacterium]|nr:class I SAM-dependent methyltransferase [Patescibacteria group bacterium]